MIIKELISIRELVCVSQRSSRSIAQTNTAQRQGIAPTSDLKQLFRISRDLCRRDSDCVNGKALARIYSR